MRLFGDKKASIEQYNRVVEVSFLGTLGAAADAVVAAVAPRESAPLLGSKVYLKAKTESQVAIGFGNKTGDFWLAHVDLTPASDGTTLIRAECMRCEKRMEISNFLHQTLKPVLDAVADLAR